MKTANAPTLPVREHLPQLNIFRAICILAVIVVHSTSVAVMYMKESSYFALYNFANIFMKFGTPSFIFLSSFVLFYSYYDRPVTKKLITGFYKKRLKFILIPYFIFSVIYYIINYNLNNRNLGVLETLEHFTSQLLIGKTYTHLYFVFINTQFYLLFPLALLLYKTYPKLLKWAIPTGFIIQYGFVFMNKFYWQVTYPGSWMFSYMSYFLLGAFLGSYFPKIKEWVIMSREHLSGKKALLWGGMWAAWLAAALSHVYVYYQTRLFGTSYNTTLYEFFWNAHTYMGVFVIMQLSFLAYRHFPSMLTKTISHLGSISFGVYLFHPLLNIIYRDNPIKSTNIVDHHLYYLGGFLFALLGSWLVVGIIVRFVPYSWILFGNTPKRKKKAPASTGAAVSGQSV